MEPRPVGRRHPQNDVDRAGQVAAQRLVAERAAKWHGVRAHGIPVRQVPLEQRREITQPDVGRAVAHVAAPERQLEVHLAQPVRQRHPAQRHPAQRAVGTAQRRVAHRDQRVGELLAVELDRPPAPLLVDVAEQLGAEVGGRRVGVLEHGVHERPEGRTHREVRHRGGQVSCGVS